MTDLSSAHADAGNTRCCLLSGASGYVGSRLKAKLVATGWRVIELSRRPTAGTGAVSFQLGQSIDKAWLKECTALIHCAYDFSKVHWDDICATNVRGSELLLRSAHDAGVKCLVQISSISAFEGCESLYGKAKLEIERNAHSCGAWVIRPGLVYGENPGAAYGRLVESIRRSTVLPIPGNGSQRTHLVHEDDLAEAVLRCLDGNRTPIPMAITVANERAWSFRSILLKIAESIGRRIILVPVPWRLIWAGLRIAEWFRIPIGLRSDSLVSLIHQNPNPLLNVYEHLGVKCRPFAPSLLR